MLLRDKVIIVTGATSGIGEATALEVARQGAKVVLAARREEKGEALAARIRDEGGKALFVRTDVSVPADIEALVARTLQAFERLDGAFNNAGIPGPLGPLADLPVDEYRKLMAVNLDSVLLCMQHEIRAMQKTGGGAIVNCASILGLVGAPTFGGYSTAKHGLIGMTKAAAVDYAAAGIRVNAVLPGPVETEIWNHVNQGEQIFAAFTQGVPMQRYARSEEIARPVVFLLSDWSSYVTGTYLAIDGGYMIR
ncbi:SDR family NAD(P)-dependent oxidoreductase [Polyangium jinanense]|uniref:Glucose 1-dehydrogenase n=1 Tax=Polyangium jinanense TaxID=2829994 RepID=A0A9X4B002_9BACT|nr:glucose 1-dehydrogenase [Polyangium jinanense]MDC3962014.1 glucose 1-dehydrogenase [Polyangium jinanense]MDC3988910.1 glucose 1-dehydrogenase [Polyangium jinanense]